MNCSMSPAFFLPPKRLGAERFYALLPELIRATRDLEAVRARRLKRHPVPVPFVYRGN